jgi:hypothetical protein
MKRSSRIRLYGINVSGSHSFYGECTIAKTNKSPLEISIQIDEEFIDEINPNKIPLYVKSDGFYTYIPYKCGDDQKFETARRFTKMWTALTLFAIQNGVNPKNLLSLVIYCFENREDSPEVTLNRWERENEELRFPGVLQLIEKAQEYLPENKVHDWVREQIGTYVSVQPCD